MQAPSPDTVRSPRPALHLALAALLLFSALQVTELVHQHTADEVAEHCLLCKADGGTAIANAAPGERLVSREIRATVARVRQAAAGFLQLPPSRGPPHHT